MFQLSAEENIRKRCQDREEYYREIRIAEKDSLLAKQEVLIQKLLKENRLLKEK